jgi:hypothetical protein
MSMTDYFAGEHDEWLDEQRKKKETASPKQRCWLCDGPLNSFNKKAGGLCSSHSEVPVYLIITFSDRSGIRVELYPDHKDVSREELESDVIGQGTKTKDYAKLIQITIPRREFDKIWIFQQGVRVQDASVNLFAPSGFQGHHFEDTFFVQIPSFVLRVVFERPDILEELRSLTEGTRASRSVCR